MKIRYPATLKRTVRNRKLWLASILALVIVASYANSLPGAFHYDDYALFLENPEIREEALNPSSLLALHAGRPLALLSLELEYRLFGENPLGFHLVSLLLHISAALVLFHVISHCSPSLLTSFLAAALFALHPIQAQAVNYIWSRSVLLAAFFLLLSVLASRTGKNSWPAALLFQLAVWSRMDALAAFPALLLLNRKRQMPVIAVGVFNLAASLYSLISAGNTEIAWNHPAPGKFLIAAPLNLLRYLKLVFHPEGYSIFHAYPEPETAALIASYAVIALILWAVILLREKAPLISAGTAWMLLMLLPSVLIPNADPVNESRVYAAFAGGSLAIASLLILFGRSISEKVHSFSSLSGKKIPAASLKILLPLACLPFLALKTIERNTIWNDDVGIWKEAVSLNQASHLPVYNLGIALARQGEFTAGSKVLLRAIKLNPADDMSYSAAGYCFFMSGRTRKAKEYYTRALELNPGNTSAREALEHLENQE